MDSSANIEFARRSARENGEPESAVRNGTSRASPGLLKSPDQPLDALLDAVADHIAKRIAGKLILPRLLSVEQAAVYLGRTEEGIRHLFAARKLARGYTLCAGSGRASAATRNFYIMPLLGSV